MVYRLLKNWMVARRPKKEKMRLRSEKEALPEEGVQASSFAISNVFVRARDEAQRKKVMQTIGQLSELWGRDNEMVRWLAHTDATYGHLEKMANLDRLSADWLHELNEAMRVAEANVLARLDEFGEKSQQDPKSYLEYGGRRQQ